MGSIVIIAVSFPGHPLFFQIDSMEVTSPTTISMEANMTMTMMLTLITETEQNTLFESFMVSINYQLDSISSTKLEPLYQEGNNYRQGTKQKTMNVVIDVKAEDHRVIVDSIAKELMATQDQDQEQALEFSVRIVTDFWTLGRSTRTRSNVIINCDGVKLRFLPASNNMTIGSMMGTPPPCKYRYSGN